jgi:hypothetical protein
MHKNQKPIIPNEQWYLAALKLVVPAAGGEDRACFPGTSPPQDPDRGCIPDSPRPRGPRRSPRIPRLPLPDRDDRGCFP